MGEEGRRFRWIRAAVLIFIGVFSAWSWLFVVSQWGPARRIDIMTFKAGLTSKIVRTLFGRLRRFPEIDSRNGNIRAMAERTAFNTIFQGTAADLIKMAMISIQSRIEREFPKAMMLIQVHDELVLEAPEGIVDAVSLMVREEMARAAALRVPLKVDIGVGKNWGEAH